MPIIHEHRLQDLASLVDIARLQKVWKATIRPGLRKQTAPDLHDHMDIHNALVPFCAALRDAVLAGAYRPREPDVIATEKGKGLLRHLLVPSAGDALLLQSIADTLEPVILRSRPSKRAFYSRSHQRPDIEHLFTRVTYPWWVKWAKFVERIWEFSRRFPFVVVTDIANYFDNIDVATLRNRLAGFAKVNEAHLDLLLYILDDIKAHAFYGVRNRLALPQIDFDAPRLLATAYLFEADELLKTRTKNSFVRWMDDIDFGAASRERAHALLGELDRRLHGLNVRVNAGKTKILTDKEAEKYFWITENIRLNKLKARLNQYGKGLKQAGASRGAAKNNARGFARAIGALERAASSFLKRVKTSTGRIGHWEKVYKRYLGLLATASSGALEPELRSLLMENPALRSTALGYLRALGFSRKRWRLLKDFLRRRGAIDHARCLEAAEVIVQWRIPTTFATPKTVRALVRQLEGAAKRSAAPFVAVLLILAKYSGASQLAAHIRRCEPVWRHSPWALRQVAACLPLLDLHDRQWVRARVVDAGISDAIRVLVSLREIDQMSSLPRNFRKYLEYREDPAHGWPVSKFIILLAVLQGCLPENQKKQLVASVVEKVTDPVYLARLASMHA